MIVVIPVICAYPNVFGWFTTLEPRIYTHRNWKFVGLILTFLGISFFRWKNIYFLHSNVDMTARWFARMRHCLERAKGGVNGQMGVS